MIGIISIEMVGGAYCPLSPRDPEQRLNTLIEQTQSRLVLIHWMTRDIFKICTNVLNIDSIIIKDSILTEIDIDFLSKICVTSESIAYVIFTSGSTGLPKAVSLHFYSLHIFKRYVNEEKTAFCLNLISSVILNH